jgi:hypothetical protein
MKKSSAVIWHHLWHGLKSALRTRSKEVIMHFFDQQTVGSQEPLAAWFSPVCRSFSEGGSRFTFHASLFYPVSSIHPASTIQYPLCAAS